MIETIKKDRIKAMKLKNRKVSTLLGLVISDVQRKQDESAESIIKSIKALIKSNRECLQELDSGSMKAQELIFEILILEEYLPEAIFGNDLRELVENELKAVDSPTMRDMGRVMKAVKETGKDFNGSEVKKYVQEFIGDKK